MRELLSLEGVFDYEISRHNKVIGGGTLRNMITLPFKTFLLNKFFLASFDPIPDFWYLGFWTAGTNNKYMMGGPFNQTQVWNGSGWSKEYLEWPYDWSQYNLKAADISPDQEFTNYVTGVNEARRPSLDFRSFQFTATKSKISTINPCIIQLTEQICPDSTIVRDVQPYYWKYIGGLFISPTISFGTYQDPILCTIAANSISSDKQINIANFAYPATLKINYSLELL